MDASKAAGEVRQYYVGPLLVQLEPVDHPPGIDRIAVRTVKAYHSFTRYERSVALIRHRSTCAAANGRYCASRLDLFVCGYSALHKNCGWGVYTAKPCLEQASWFGLTIRMN